MRLQEILGYDCPDGPAEASLNQICLLAQSLFKVPIALVTLVGRDKQKFLAKCGVNADGTSRKDAFCTYAILDDEVLIVVLRGATLTKSTIFERTREILLRLRPDIDT